MLIICAFALIAMIGFAALAVDLSQLYATQAQLEAAAAAAATAGAVELPDESTASSMALQFAALNMSGGANGDVLAAQDVETGNWNTTARVFTPGGTPLNAVRVTTRRSSVNGNPVGPIFSGLLGSSEKDLQASATAMLLPLLPGGMSSTGDISLSGTVSIDSYHSTDGLYDPDTAGDNGDVVTEGNVSVGGSVTVNGDVSGAGVSSHGGADVTGDMTTPRRPIDWPAVDTTDFESNNDNDQLPPVKHGKNLVSPLDADGNFALSSGVDYEMPPGTYYFNDLTLNGQASLNLSGLTVIYLTGDLDTSGGDVVNATQDPKNFIIFMTGGSATINASVDWYGIVYAPNTDFQMNGSADFFGAVVGAAIDASGSVAVHYDEDVSAVLDGQIDLPHRSSLVN